MKVEIRRVWDENFGVYGAEKVWKQLNREGIPVARCTCSPDERDGARRGREGQGFQDDDDPRGRGLASAGPGGPGLPGERPNELWVSDLTYVATWRGFVYVAFVIDAFARRIVGWRVSTSLRSDLALDALEQAIAEREDDQEGRLIHPSDHGVQYLSIRYTERLAEAGIEPSVGSVGDSYDNALAESIIGLFKTEVIRRLGPWRNVEDVEFATLEWVWWFNYHRLLGPIGHVPPVEYEEMYYQGQTGSTEEAELKENSLR